MKVEELIAQLKNINPETEVVFSSFSSDTDAEGIMGLKNQSFYKPESDKMFYLEPANNSDIVEKKIDCIQLYYYE